MRRIGLVLLWGGLLSTWLGCGPPQPQPQPVSGKVTLDGQPLSEGKISFFPVTHEPPAVLDIKSGAYSGQAVEGESQVQIAAFKKGQKPVGMPDSVVPDINYLPAKYHSASTLKAVVKPVKPGEPDKKNVFDFEVTSN